MVGAQDDKLLLRSGSNTALTLDSSQNATFAGAITTPKLTLTDDGAAGPIFMLKTDDHSPWGFIIKNDTYSTSADVGLKAYQANDGDFYLRLQGNTEYNNFYLRQHNGTTTRSLVTFDASGDATFAGKIISSSSSSGDYIRTYAGSGTGKWDIYGNGANLRISDNDSAGKVQLDRAAYFPDNIKLEFGDATTPDLSIWHGESNSGTGENANYINSASGRNIVLQVQDDANGIVFHKRTGTGVTNFELISAFTAGGANSFYYDGVKKLETTSSGAKVSGSIEATGQCKLNDSFAYVAGTDNDLQIWHSGAHATISNSTGYLHLNSANVELKNAAGNETMLLATQDAAVKLYHGMGGSANAETKFETSTTGVTLTGGLNATYDSSAVAALYLKNTNDSGTVVQFAKNDGGIVGSITQTTSATAYNTSSDYRLKENEVAISDGITRLKTLKPYRFNFKTDSSTTVDGFFAHEAQTVVPEAVTGTKDEVDSDGKAVIQGIDQSKLVPLLTAALQEAVTKIETLEAKVAALEAG